MLSLHDFYGLLPINIYNVFMIFVPLLIPQLHRFGENIGAIALATLLLLWAFSSLVLPAWTSASDLQVYFHIIFKHLSPLGGSASDGALFLVFFALSLAALADLADLVAG